MSTAKRPKKKLRKDQVKNLETAAATAEAAQVTTLPAEDRASRDIEMFRGWINGKTYNVLAQEYGLNRTTVATISKKYNWRNLRKELVQRRLNAAMERQVDFHVLMQDTLERDVRAIINDALEAKRNISKDERDHIRALFTLTLKEMRLEQGKPTDINNNTGPVQVAIVLPQGARRFGVIPPDPKVTVLEQKQAETTTVDLDDLEDESND